MNKFRGYNYGFILKDVSDAVAERQFTVLRLVRKSLDNDLTTENKVATVEDVLGVNSVLVGLHFKDFLEAIHNSGRGTLSLLAKSIVQYVNGKIGVKTLLTQIAMEENKLGKYVPNNKNYKLPNLLQPGTTTNLIETGYYLDDNSVFKLLEGIGPVNYARILLLIRGGVEYGHVRL